MLIEDAWGMRRNCSMKCLKKKDDIGIQQPLTRMQNRNPNFFYSLDLNHHGCPRNLLWTDESSRVLRKYFEHGARFKGEYCEFSHDCKDQSICMHLLRERAELFWQSLYP
ncbi:hypothetical protein KFK09_022987 [Dendrobium nobile]|uniref:Uncharacterized protein n=1 Tax=Dendrobium nobile TaxID=94219 RepID=A0A8T3AKU9_DENNO|nr:hypothetical protein KFK09_022987 [Dendrobium nobile]